MRRNSCVRAWSRGSPSQLKGAKVGARLNNEEGNNVGTFPRTVDGAAVGAITTTLGALEVSSASVVGAGEVALLGPSD